MFEFHRRFFLSGLLLSLSLAGLKTRDVAGQQQLKKSSAIALVPQLGHATDVTSVAISPSGQYAVSGSEDFSVVLWEIATGREIRRFPGHTKAVTSVAFSSNGQAVLSGSEDGTMRLWEVKTGEERGRYGRTSPNWGERLVSHFRRSPSRFEPSPIRSIALSPHGAYAVCGSSEGVSLWDLKTGHRIRSLLMGNFLGIFQDYGGNTLVAFSPDGRYVIGGSMFHGEIWFWDVETGKLLHSFKDHKAGITAISFSHDGRFFISGSRDSTIILWDASHGSKMKQYFHNSAVLAVAFSPDARHILTSSSDATVRLWETATGHEIRRFKTWENKILSLAFSSEGNFVLGGTDRGYLLGWLVKTGQVFAAYLSYATFPHSLATHGDSLLIGEWQNIWLWDLHAGRPIRSFNGHNGFVKSVTFSPNGQYALSGSDDKTMRLWEVKTGKELHTFTGHTGEVESVAFSPNGQYALSGSADSSIVLWNVAQYISATLKRNVVKLQKTFQKDKDIMSRFRAPSSVSSVDFNSDAQHALSSMRNSISLWDLKTGRSKHPFRYNTVEPSYTLSSAVFSPNGRYILAGGFHGEVLLWDKKTEREVRRLIGHTGLVRKVSFDPSGDFAFSTGEDKTIRMWDLKTELEKHRFEGHNFWVNSLAVSRDGRLLLSSSFDGTIRFWNVESGKLMATLILLNESEEQAAGWVVMIPEGRFDTDNLEEIRGLHWTSPDEPMKPLSIEIYMRDYFEPNLLRRLLAGEKLPFIRDVSQLNRVQPRVEIRSIEQVTGHPDQVSVTVEVKSQTDMVNRNGKKIQMKSGAYDLRLFRDGQLVAQFPEPSDELIGQIAIDTLKLKAWREASAIKLGKATKTFRIKLPRRKGLETVDFSAYAFNEDRVKSSTAKTTYTVPKELERVKGRAYVITVGVTNTNDPPYWSLNYAAEDAKLMKSQLDSALKKNEAYEEVVPITLISKPLYAAFLSEEEKAFIEPSKTNIKTVLNLLAGRNVHLGLEQIPVETRRKLRPVEPQDLVVLSFSAHGVKNKKGDFYLLPYDIGVGSNGEITAALLKNSISSEELSLWLRELDAELVMIIDACYSEAAAKVAGFKPGPMGDRGLGQLSYDKGMPILVAAQSDSVALESAKGGGYSLLTQALANEGLAQGKAARENGQMTLTDVLKYAVERVPKLYVELEVGNKGSLQQPSLFDFGKKKIEVTLARPGQSSSNKKFTNQNRSIK